MPVNRFNDLSGFVVTDKKGNKSVFKNDLSVEYEEHLKFDEKKINQGIVKYLEIQAMVYNPFKFCSEEFKKKFNGFYRVRQKTPKWYEHFYNTFEQCKDKKLSFKEVLTIMWEKTHEIDASFCSKIIATIDPSKPVWDKYVLQWLGIILDMPKNPKEKIEYCSKIYDHINDEYRKHIYDGNVIETFKHFNSVIKHAEELNPIKKIDFILWSNRSDRTVSILEYNRLLDRLKEKDAKMILFFKKQK